MYPFCSSCLLILFFYLFIHISYSVILPVLSLLFVITNIDFFVYLHYILPSCSNLILDEASLCFGTKYL